MQAVSLVGLQRHSAWDGSIYENEVKPQTKTVTTVCVYVPFKSSLLYRLSHQSSATTRLYMINF